MTLQSQVVHRNTLAVACQQNSLVLKQTVAQQQRSQEGRCVMLAKHKMPVTECNFIKPVRDKIQSVEGLSLVPRSLPPRSLPPGTRLWRSYTCIFVPKCHPSLSLSFLPPSPPFPSTYQTHTLPYFQCTYTHSQFLDSNKSRTSFISSHPPATSTPPITITASEVGQSLFLAKELKKAFVSLQQEKVIMAHVILPNL